MSRSDPVVGAIRWLATGLTTAVLASACGVPVPPDPTADARDDIVPSTARELLDPTDVGSDVLGAQLTVLAERVAEIQQLLRAAEELLAAPVGPGSSVAGQLQAASELGDAALVLLLGDGSGEGDPVGLLPNIEPDRAARGSADLITATVTLAGDVGGERSRTVLELVRDPMVGDLGVWQRDPLGVIALLRATAGTATEPATLDRDLQAYSGLLTRTLAYVLVLTTTSDPVLARHAAGTGAAHLAVVGFAIDDTRTEVTR
jgi:hypothetical protein